LLDDFKKFIEAYIENLEQEKLLPEIEIDSLATVRGATPNFIKMLMTQMGPFGIGNPEPFFALSDIRVHSVDLMKEKHIRLMMSDMEGGQRMKAVFFNGVETPLGAALIKNHKNTCFHLVGQFQINNWQGRESVEFHLSDGISAQNISQSNFAA